LLHSSIDFGMIARRLPGELAPGMHGRGSHAP